MLVYHKVTYKMPQRNTENMLLGRLPLCSLRQTSPWWTSRVTAYVNNGFFFFENMLLVCCLVGSSSVCHQSAAEIHTLGRASFPALFNCPRSSPTGATNWVMAPFTTLRSKTQPQMQGLCYTRVMVSMNIKDYPYIGLSTSET